MAFTLKYAKIANFITEPGRDDEDTMLPVLQRVFDAVPVPLAAWMYAERPCENGVISESTECLHCQYPCKVETEGHTYVQEVGKSQIV